MIPEYDELLVLAETLGEVKTKTEKLEAEFSTQARPLEAATNALSAALAGIKALQFHVLDNNLGALSARVEEMRKAVDEQVGVIALELKRADETNAAKAGQDAEALRAEIAGLQAQLGTLGAQFTAQLARVEFAAKEEAKALQLIPGPAGATGASLNPRGTFVDGETYKRLDVVSWLGSSYIAAVDGVTEKPSKNSNQWQVLASRGGGAAGGAGDFGSLAGVAQINQGGTGQTTRAAGLNALLPDQAGNTQYMLLTDGAGTVSWGAQPVAGLPSQTSNGGKLLTTDGTNASWSGAVTVSGSNATVTGTLTVNGTGTNSIPNLSVTGIGGLNVSANFLTSANTLRFSDSASGGQTWFMSPQLGDGVATNFAFYSNDGVTSTPLFRVSSAGVFRLPATTASTTTSTGALVVSGGVGIAKALFAGESAYFAGAVGATDAVIKNGYGRSANGYAYVDLVGDTTYTDYGMRIIRNNSGANANSQIAHRGTGALQLIASDAGTIEAYTNGANLALAIDTSQQVQVKATTASTSTSTGALVVSGGVGVAGAMYIGGLIECSSASGIRIRTASGTAASFAVIQTGNATWEFKSPASDSSLVLRANDTTNALQLTNTGNGIFAGSVSTSAPSGGTAAAWKLGTVASVSPTSPNRTIEVDIGGTIYYIHAKTTNN